MCCVCDSRVCVCVSLSLCDLCFALSVLSVLLLTLHFALRFCFSVCVSVTSDVSVTLVLGGQVHSLRLSLSLSLSGLSVLHLLRSSSLLLLFVIVVKKSILYGSSGVLVLSIVSTAYN